VRPARYPSALRTPQFLRAAGIETRVVEFGRPTRTGEEAAAAIGSSVAEIARSVLLRGKTSGRAVIVVASGDNRVSEAKDAATLREPLARADADFVRMATGYASGGVAPKSIAIQEMEVPGIPGRFRPAADGSLVAMPRSSRPSKSAPVMMRFWFPQNRIMS